MGAGNGRNFMPDNQAGFLRVSNTWLIEGEVFNALGIEMNLAMLFAHEAFQQFGKRALRAMPAINEGGDDGEAQVSASVSAGHTKGQAERWHRIAGKARAWVNGTRFQGAARSRRSGRNPRTSPIRQTSWEQAEVLRTRR